MDEMWSFVGHKGNPRWLWHAIDHHTGKVLAYVFGRRKDAVFLRLKALLEPFGLTRYYTDYWGAYTRHLDPDEHCPGKRHTQKIERKHLTLRTRMKRLARKTLCFSKTTQMHDVVVSPQKFEAESPCPDGLPQCRKVGIIARGLPPSLSWSPRRYV
jgi:insertion element IS1 protein InsB